MFLRAKNQSISIDQAYRSIFILFSALALIKTKRMLSEGKFLKLGVSYSLLALFGSIFGFNPLDLPIWPATFTIRFRGK